MRIRLIHLLILFYLCPQLAHAGTLAFVVNAGAGKIDNQTPFLARGLDYGGGLLWEATLFTLTAIKKPKTFHFLTFETGGVFSQRNFSLDMSGVVHQYQEKAIEVPLQFRFWYSRVFSFGLGAYVAFPIGTVSDSSAAGIEQLRPSPSSEVGASIGVRFILNNTNVFARYIHVSQVKWFLEAKYNLSTTPMDTSGGKTFDSIKIQFGARLGVTPYGI